MFLFYHSKIQFHPLKSPLSTIHISSVLSLRSSRSQRRQFSTMMTVRAQRYQQAARYKIHDITYMFNINIIHNILVTYSISMTSTISTDLENACRLTGSWTPWCARTPSTSPPSLRGSPSMLQTRTNLDLLGLTSQNFISLANHVNLDFLWLTHQNLQLWKACQS